ncbi:MAG TPA: hypothetical protein VJR89_03520, partial [Polyangiales bacterium]|nr:hypothetical protein [Polyangiales bacterium]
AIQFKTIVIERDTGATLQVASGIREGERVVRLASARLQEGMHVQVKEKEKNSGSGSGSGSGSKG